MEKRTKPFTADELQLMDDMLQEWRKLGTQTGPADRKVAEEALKTLYKLNGQKEPTIYWAKGRSHALDVAIETGLAKTRKDAASLSWVSGSPHWLADGLFGLAIGLKFPDDMVAKMRAWEKLARVCPTSYLFEEKLCIISDNPKSVSFDAEYRLHRDNGPAFEGRDGLKLYSWHGVTVPEEWIEKPDEVDASLALTWENIEQRRCLAEILGWAEVLKQLNPEVVDESTPDVGTLLRCDLPDSPGEMFLRVACGTGREFVLPVPPNMKTARQANAWTYGFEPDEWAPKVRT